MTSDRLKAVKKQLKAQRNTDVTHHSLCRVLLPAGLSDRNGYDALSASRCAHGVMFILLYKNVLRTSAVSSGEFRVNTHLCKLRCWYL